MDRRAFAITCVSLWLLAALCLVSNNPFANMHTGPTGMRAAHSRVHISLHRDLPRLERVVRGVRLSPESAPTPALAPVHVFARETFLALSRPAQSPFPPFLPTSGNSLRAPPA